MLGKHLQHVCVWFVVRFIFVFYFFLIYLLLLFMGFFFESVKDFRNLNLGRFCGFFFLFFPFSPSLPHISVLLFNIIVLPVS